MAITQTPRYFAAKTGTLYTPEACGTAQNALNRMKNDPFAGGPVLDSDPTIDCVGS
jgi:hypothetical protein